MPEPGETLSERELQVLRLVATGATNDQIARELVISVNTVKVHLRNIFTKLGVSSRTEASLHAVREGWVTLAPPAVEEEAGPSTVTNAAAGERAVRHPILSRWPRWGSILGIAVLLIALAISLTGAPYRWLSSGGTTYAPPSPAYAQRWTTLSDMPTARGSLALVPYQEFLYAIGGENWEVSAAIERFDLARNSWTPLAPKPTAVAEIQAAVIGGRIYVPGGRDAQGRPTAVVEAYDVEGNRWFPAASLPHPLSGYALTAFEGNLYLFGGWDGSRYRDEILRYDPRADRWEQVGQTPFPWGHAGAVVASNRIFLLGGINEEGPIDVVLEYSISPPMGETIPLPGISLGRTRASALGNYLYVLAEPASSPPQLWQYNTGSKEWVQKDQQDPAPLGLYPGGAISAIGAEDLILVGGRDGETYLSLNQKYRALFTVPSVPVLAP